MSCKINYMALKQQLALEAYMLEDSQLFAMWIYGDSQLYPDKSFNIKDLFLGWSYGVGNYDFLKKTLKDTGVEFRYVGLFAEADKDVKLPILREELKSVPDKEARRIIRASEKINLDAVHSDEFDLVARFRPNAYGHIYLYPELSEDDAARIKNKLDKYILSFMNGELLVRGKNCLRFEKQKAEMIRIVRQGQMIERFGENFVLEHGGGHVPEGFFFVHTLYALQKMGYLKVMSLAKGSALSDGCSAAVIVDRTFIEEVEGSFRSENPKTVFRGFDEKKFVLNFADQEIQLSKGRKETDAVLLMKTLVKEPDRDWFDDEILDDWKYEKDETSKLKIYQAARKINQLVRDATSVTDFLDHNTRKFRINGKYLKV